MTTNHRHEPRVNERNGRFFCATYKLYLDVPATTASDPLSATNQEEPMEYTSSEATNASTEPTATQANLEGDLS